MMRLYPNHTGCIVADVDGKKMLVDTGATRSFYDEYRGVLVSDLSRLLGIALDGVLGMDRLNGQVLSLSGNTMHINGTPPDIAGIPVSYASGIPCVDIKINEVPCRAAIKTSSGVTYIADELLSRDRHSAFADDFHPVYGNFRVNKFVNYFSIANRSFFAGAAALPCESSLFGADKIDAIIGMDLLKRFDLIMDFSLNRLYLISN